MSKVSIKTILLRSLCLFLFSVGILFAFFSDTYQPDYRKIPTQKIYRTFSEQQYLHSLDSLIQLYGQNKTLPTGYELQSLLALSHYPELKNTKISFRLEKAFLPLASRPNLRSMFNKKTDWKYRIIISTDSGSLMKDIHLDALPFNAQVGVLGHELAHTLYYQDKNFIEICRIGIKYLFPSYRLCFEKDTDLRTIYHGLGWQLYDYACYTKNNTSSKKINAFKSYYLSSDEILNEINKLDIYRNGKN